MVFIYFIGYGKGNQRITVSSLWNGIYDLLHIGKRINLFTLNVKNEKKNPRNC